MLQDITLSFIGSGMMAEAMIAGLLIENLIEPGQIIAAGPRAERGEKLAARYGVRWTTDNEEAAEKGQIVVLSVKPQVLKLVIPQVRGHLRRQDRREPVRDRRGLLHLRGRDQPEGHARCDATDRGVRLRPRLP